MDREAEEIIIKYNYLKKYILKEIKLIEKRRDYYIECTGDTLLTDDGALTELYYIKKKIIED